MKLHELPIYWDLVRLPFPTVIKRLGKRFFTRDEAKVPSTTLGLTSLRSLVLGAYQLSPNNLAIGEKLWGHYQNAEFNYLGSGWVCIKNKIKPSGFNGINYWQGSRKQMGKNDINWNRDQRSGFQFDIEGKPRECLKVAFAKDEVDVKFAWEFARLHHLPQLGILVVNMPQAHAEIVETFQMQIKSFQKNCPPGAGVQWSSPMEVAIRLVNILVGYNLLDDLQKKIAGEISKMALEHWHFLKINLEDKEGLGTNHYLSNLMGLVVASFFLENEEVSKTGKWAFAEFEKELKKQFFKDGFNFEYSTYYHRLSTEITLITLHFAQKQGLQVADESKKLLQKALQNLLVLQKPDKTLPQFGDSDSGRILDLLPDGDWWNDEFIPEPEQCSFINQLFKKGSLYHWFYRSLLDSLSIAKPLVTKDYAGQFRVKKLKYSAIWQLNFEPIDSNAVKVYHIEEGGLIIFKSKEFYLAVNLMVNASGHRYRGHSHNDKGSFELTVHGKNLVVDPGTYSYTASADLRNDYRSTAAHPVPFTGVEQNRYLPGFLGLFHTMLDVKVKLLEINKSGCGISVNYRGVKCIRKFEIFDTHLIVHDWCNKPFTVNKNENIRLAAGYGKLK